jgi:hypothetical protein
VTDPPVAVTVEVPVSGDGGTVEVTVTLTARRVPGRVLLDAHAVGDEPGAK